jgi:hypothetical protein
MVNGVHAHPQPVGRTNRALAAMTAADTDGVRGRRPFSFLEIT